MPDEWITHMPDGRTIHEAVIETMTANPGEKRPAPSLATTLIPHDTPLMRCWKCGAAVVDPGLHIEWHADA